MTSGAVTRQPWTRTNHSRTSNTNTSIRQGSPISGVSASVFSGKGAFRGYRGTAQIITERKLAQRKLAESENRLRQAVESLSEGFTLYDADDRLVIANERAISINPAMREVMAEHMGPGPAPVDDSGRALHQHKRMSHAQRRSHMSDARRLADLENRVDMMQVMLESMMSDHSENQR